MAPEQKLYRELKKATPKIIWNRIENLSIPGMPDLLGYNKSGTFFTVELKVTEGRKIRFSPHQIAFHVTHPNNTFIMVRARGPRSTNRYQMFRGSRIMELVASGLKLRRSSEEPSELEALCGLDAIRDFFYQLGA